MDFSLKGRISPEAHARNLIHELRITSWPISVKDIAEQLGLKYVEADLRSDNIDGGLDLRCKPYILVINSRITYDGRKNFTGGHELGHYRIPEHREHNYMCSPFDVASYDATDKRVEQEANRFATELLMPLEMVKEFIKGRKPDFRTAQAIAERFRVSVTSASIRMIEATEEAAAIVVSQNGRIQWSSRAKNFRHDIYMKDKPLHEHTYAVDFFKGSGVEMKGFEQVLPHTWIASRGLSQDAELYEHSVHFQEFGTVMTILSMPIGDDEIDEW